MPDKRLLQGQITLLLGVTTILLWYSPAVIPVAFAIIGIGVYLVMTARSGMNDWMKP